MQLGQVSNVVTFFTILITESNCDELKRRTEISQSFQEVETILTTQTLLQDYLGMEILRRYMMQSFRNSDFFFVGNSFAYIGLEMMMRDRLMGSNSGMFRLVPFSGNFYGSIDNQFTRDPENYPTDEEIGNYRRELHQIGLDPSSILERYEISGRRTVIVQDVGLGLVSFLDILCSWARLQGISSERLRIALKAYGIIFENNGFPNTSVIAIDEFSVDLVRLELTSQDPIDTVRRIAYPQRNTGYVRLLPNYPHQLWNEPPPDFEEDYLERRRIIITRLAGVMSMMANLVAEIISSTSSTTARTVPTADVRNGSDLEFFCPLPGPSRESRFRRDLSNQKRIFFEDGVLKPLEEIHAYGSKMSSLDEFFNHQMINSSLSVNKILHQICDHYDYSNNGVIVSSEKVHFSSSKWWTYSCIRRHRLLNCNIDSRTAGVVQKIAASVAKIFSGTQSTRKNIVREAKNLIIQLIFPYSEDLVNYLAEATKEAALYCSDEKVTSTLQCPAPYHQYLGQIMLSLLGRSTQKNANLKRKELVDYIERKNIFFHV